MESLILGCLKYDADENHGGFWFEPEGIAKISRHKLGTTLDATFRMLMTDEKKQNTLTKRIEKKKDMLKKDIGDTFYFYMLKMIQYYVLAVYKQVERAGDLGITEYIMNKGLIMQDLQDQILNTMEANGLFENEEDLKNKINSINLDYISEILPYDDVEAFDKLRILSVPEKGISNAV